MIFNWALALAVVVLLWWVFRLKARLAAAEAASGVGESSVPGESRLIGPSDAQAEARRGLEAYGLTSRKDWRPYIGQFAVPQKPALVQRLDPTSADTTFYYIVPLGADADTATAAVRVSGGSGRYLEATPFVTRHSVPSWGSLLAKSMDDTTIRQRVAGRTIRRRGTEVNVFVDDRGITVHSVFVWKPCVESCSPYFPFRLVWIGDHPLYIRIDGEEFWSLTDLDAIDFPEDDHVDEE